MEGLGIRSWEVILTYADTLHSYRAHTNVTILFCMLADDEHIAPSSRPPRSSERPRRQECGTAPCVSRRVRTDHHQPRTHPIRQWRTRAAGSLAFLPPPQPAHGDSTKSPLRGASATDAGAFGNSMEHGNDIHHASALTPQPRAAIDQQPPFASKPAECWNRRPR